MHINSLETTFYQQLTITIHPDIQKPGLVHIPIRTTEPLKDNAEEKKDYITTTSKGEIVYSVLAYSAIFASCLASGITGGMAAPVTALLAFALIVKSDK